MSTCQCLPIALHSFSCFATLYQSEFAYLRLSLAPLALQWVKVLVEDGSR